MVCIRVVWVIVVCVVLFLKRMSLSTTLDGVQSSVMGL